MTATVVLQPGTVINAQVLQILGNDTVRIAIGGQSIDVLSQVPLQAGQTLQLAVSQTADGTIRLAVVNPQAARRRTRPAGRRRRAASDAVTLAPGASAGIAAPTTRRSSRRSNQLTPLEALAVSVAAQTAATQQTSLAPLFANLGVAAGLAGLPPQVQQAVAQVLAQRTSLDQGLTGDDIKQAFQSSGLFLEASLAIRIGFRVGRHAGSQGGADRAAPGADDIAQWRDGYCDYVGAANGGDAQPGTTPGPVVPEQAAQPSIQGSPQPVTITVAPEMPTTASPALAPLLASEIVAPAVLLRGETSPIPEGILEPRRATRLFHPRRRRQMPPRAVVASSAALNLLQEVVQAGPLTAGNPSRLLFDDGLMLSLLPAVAGARVLNVDDAEFARTNVPPPPISGALPAAQPVMPATLVSNSPLETAMHHLLADTDGAIARQTLLQVASLPGQTDTTASRLDPAAPRWNFEIPFATPQGTAMAQFEISRDGGGSEVEAAKRVWRARFSLDVEPAGPVHALVSLSGDRTSVRMWAERPATAEQLRAGVAQLSQALSRAELQPGDIVIRDGAPLQPVSAPAGHFLDRAL